MKFVKPFGILLGICLLFFYKAIVFGKVPIPGDLLISQYAPWRHQSYDGYIAGAVPSKDQYFDVLRELYPWKTLVIDEVKQGHMPLWNPYNFSGSPLLANWQSQVLYPFTFLYYIFPQITAWTIMVILQPVLGSLFLYLFATQIGLSAPAAIISALLFNFSGFASVWMEYTTIWHTILWLPLLLYLVERNVKQKKLYVGQQLLVVFALYSAITGGHPQDFIYSFIFLLVYVAFRRSLSLIPLFIIPFFLAAPQILPTIELFQHSARVAHDYQGTIQTMLVQWWQTPLLVIADFFGNPATKTNITGDYVGKTLSIGPVGFSLIIFSFLRKRVWHEKFFLAASVFIILLTVRSPLTELLYRYPWPVLSTGTPTRILFLLALSLSILAGFGFDAIGKIRKLPVLPLGILWAIILILWFFAPLTHPMIFATALVIALTGIVIVSVYRKWIYLFILPLVVAELLWGFLKFNPFVPQSFIFPDNTLITKLKSLGGIDRVWGYGTASIEANFATQVGLYSPDGTDPLNLHWYNRFIQSSHDGNIAQLFNRTTRSDAYLAPGYGESDLPQNPYRLRVMDVLGIKYVVNRTENPKNDTTFDPERFREIWHEGDWTIYENRNAAPRIFTTGDIRPYDSDKDFETQFFSESFNPAKSVLIARGDWESLSDIPKLDRQNMVTVVTYDPTYIRVTVTADVPQLLVVSDTFDNGWSATVNGKQATIYKTNYAFRGLKVPKGDSLVEFRYRPRSFSTGIAISSITLLLISVYFIFQVKRKNIGKIHNTKN